MAMPRGRNSKASVLKDNARERKQQEADASSLMEAASVIERRFTGESIVIGRLIYLAEMIREGDVDFTDFLVAEPGDSGYPEPIPVEHRWNGEFP
jgi:hypothetical protein